MGVAQWDPNPVGRWPLIGGGHLSLSWSKWLVPVDSMGMEVGSPHFFSRLKGVIVEPSITLLDPIGKVSSQSWSASTVCFKALTQGPSLLFLSANRRKVFPSFIFLEYSCFTVLFVFTFPEAVCSIGYWRVSLFHWPCDM